MAQQNLLFVTGQHLSEAGMHAAITHAERRHGDWAAQAMNALRVYLAVHPSKEFKAEDVRAYAYDVLALPYPPHERSWGAIMSRAANQGLIIWLRFEPVNTPTSHRANASVWRAA